MSYGEFLTDELRQDGDLKKETQKILSEPKRGKRI